MDNFRWKEKKLSEFRIQLLLAEETIEQRTILNLPLILHIFEANVED
jgi:hypothetical protein